jgi:hypothetical protein
VLAGGEATPAWPPALFHRRTMRCCPSRLCWISRLSAVVVAPGASAHTHAHHKDRGSRRDCQSTQGGASRTSRLPPRAEPCTCLPMRSGPFWIGQNAGAGGYRRKPVHRSGRGPITAASMMETIPGKAVLARKKTSPMEQDTTASSSKVEDPWQEAACRGRDA